MTSTQGNNFTAIDRRSSSNPTTEPANPPPIASPLEHTVESPNGNNVQDCIRIFEDTHNKLKSHLTTFDVEFMRAYVSAADAHLKNDLGNHDYSRLDDSSINSLFSKSIVGSLESFAKKYLDTADGVSYDPIKRSMAFSGTFGITPDKIISTISQYRANYTTYTHNGLGKNIHDDMQKRLQPSTVEHFVKDDISKIIKYMKFEEKINPLLIELDEAKQLLLTYKSYDNSLPEKLIKDKPYYIK